MINALTKNIDQTKRDLDTTRKDYDRCPIDNLDNRYILGEEICRLERLLSYLNNDLQYHTKKRELIERAPLRYTHPVIL